MSHPVNRRDFIRLSGVALALGLGLPAQRAGALTINPRSSWATEPPQGPLVVEDVKFLIVHHSASRNGHTPAEVPGILRSFYEFHTGPEKGWPDIAYNFLIDSGGGIWEGRQGSIDGPIAGDATGGNQGFTQLVCVIGDYNAAVPSAASLGSLVALLGWLADRYAIATEPGSKVTFTSRGSNLWPAGAKVTTPTITGHRTMSQTTCPGDNLNDYVVDGLMADVTASRSGETVIPPSPTTSPPTSPPTTQAPPPPTTTSSPTTTIAETTTRAPATSSSSTSPDSTPSTSPATTRPLSLAPPATVVATVPEPERDLMIPAVGTGLAALATGALVWRYRRMSEDEDHGS